MIASFDPRTGAQDGGVDETLPERIEEALTRAAIAAGALASTPPATRRAWLDTLADALEERVEELATLADSETALGMVRLRGEVARTAGQLRFYGAVAAEGGYLGVTVDGPAGTSPVLVRVNRPLGPVAVFGASNFPFAFSVLGNDTASALAAGCPVVVKGHPAHPRLSEELGRLATEVLAGAGAPDGTFALVHGYDAGVQIVRASEVQAVAFTGSQGGGLALWKLANERERVIPVFAEMGTVNPVVVTPDAAATRRDEVAAGFVGSFTMGSGQYCTKPGMLFAPRGAGMPEAVGRALVEAAPEPVMLTEAIARAAVRGAEDLLAAGAVEVAAVGDGGPGWGAPARVLRAAPDALQPGSRLLEECFGAVAVVVEYDDADQLYRALDVLQPSLAASVFTGESTDDAAARAVAFLAGKVGRVAVNDWPTGVAYTWAQQHGGPWPSTSVPSATSVGAAALGRFVRPAAFQGARDGWLPPEARADNPWGLPRRIDGVLESAG